MTLLRRLGYAALALAFAQIVFGAVVRITGSGLGCGEHWPTCNGVLFPALSHAELVIELAHRYLAAAVTVAVLALLGVAWAQRSVPGVGGTGGVLRAAGLAALLVLTAAVFGAVTVKLALDPYVIAIHLAFAMALLAVLSAAVLRAGGWGIARHPVASARTARAAAGAAGIAFLTVVLGALTANVAGANVACEGFPWCRATPVTGGPLHIQLTHRVLAFLLFFHTLGMAIAVGRRRGESPVIGRAAWLAFGVVAVQLVVAAVLVELRLPPFWRSLHQAVGTLVWLSTFTFAALARRASPLGASIPAPRAAWT